MKRAKPFYDLVPAGLLITLVAMGAPACLGGGNGDAPPRNANPTACNGRADLCDRSFEQMTMVSTHNGMSNAADGWELPNHNVGIEQQLQDGVRVLGMDIQVHDDVVKLCHTFCQLGERLLLDALLAVKDFLDNNIDEVVVIDFQDDSGDIQALADVFGESGLLPYIHSQPVGQPFPSLAEMIASGQRLVVFGTSSQDTPDWYLDYWDFIWVTWYGTSTTAEMTCDLDRGEPDSPLFQLHHTLSDPFPDRQLAVTANSNPFLIERAIDCWAETGKRPNLISVDFYDIGNVFEAVDILNNLDSPDEYVPE